MNEWIIELLKKVMHGTGQKIKIDKDHLPGLKPPNAAPKLPPVQPPRIQLPPDPDIDGMYSRYVAQGNGSKKKQAPRGLSF